MRSQGAEMCEAADIGFVFEPKIVSESQMLNPRLRHHVFLIFKEALNNAVKYSGASQIHIALNIDERRLGLEVIDNGKGFDPATVERSNGLNSMAKRASELAAVLQFEPQTGGGTVVRLVVPDIRKLPELERREKKS